MKDSVKLALWVCAPYLNDAIFSDPNPADPDKRLAPFCALKAAIMKQGGSCHTQDVFLCLGQVPDIALFLDIPSAPVERLFGEWKGKVRRFAMLQEPEPIIPRNWRLSFHDQFEKILTWNDDLVDNVRYFKFNYGNILPKTVPGNIGEKQKLCAMIAGNHKSGHPLELYSKRVEIIRWFEENHPEDFDLYGRGWDEFIFQGPKIVRAFNRIKPLKRLLAPVFPSYLGPVQKKLEVLAKYRFSICYENSSGMPGFISEKIFDCFAAGVLPVYWGAPNIMDYIPADCFLDKREFSTYESLYQRMKEMPDAEYLLRLAAIETFLNSEKGREFSVERFTETLVEALLN